MTWLMPVVAVFGAAISGVRWLRVAQREHYIVWSTTTFARRWWKVGMNPVLATLGIAALAAMPWMPWIGLVAVVVWATGPIGLSIRGRTSPLAWTSRLRRLAALSAVFIFASGWLLGLVDAAPLVVAVVPVLVDVALAVLSPIERRLGNKWVAQAASALARSNPRVVAITGSYGKTSTKVMVGHLLAGLAPTVTSPASFNNRMGLARSVNEGLVPGTEVFVAEMGIFGAGEIADLCEWIPPEVGVITAIGPVHLERMGSLERIVEAKREILAKVSVGVLNVDSPHLAAIADEEASRIRVIRCSASDPDAEVFADPSTGTVFVSGSPIGVFDPMTAQPGNVACAVGTVLALGYDTSRLEAALASLPVARNRQTVSMGTGGFTIIDDTFNSNPAGARSALAKLAAAGGRRSVVVTPGMVELGSVQHSENKEFARQAAAVATDLVIVGRTNREALALGAAESGMESVIVVATREEAVAWVKAQLGRGDAVLYENDLPDHYP